MRYIIAAAAGWNRNVATGLALLLAAASVQAQVSQADIDYWTRTYDGAELARGVAHCGDPAIPELSRTLREVKAVLGRFDAWNACYEQAIAKLEQEGDPVNHVPAPIRFGMSVDDYKRAQTHMDEVYARVVAGIGSQASPVIERYDAWRARTADYVQTAENDRIATVKLMEEVADRRKKAGVARMARESGRPSRTTAAR